ncbi:SpaH/EbpB family LPXTG-anchored major pilin [Gemmiger sp.]|uniref:SpaH/EbpB family LPXTG-anchored major pilin n=1 Tax=Gemmiger sp. TaxID=2049027 RepID=UPI0029432E86|nr:SpaH/EbpB family LPXTG-anchored major pilin [uncultured Gemmiger sp.]
MKLKRLLTAALSAVMALSVCALPAMAEGTTSTSTFDPSITKGTLTISKYEQTEADKTKTDANEKKGKLLDGVEFTVYKLADIKQVDGKLVYAPVAALNRVLSDDDFNDATAEGSIDSEKLYKTISQKLSDVHFDMSTLSPESKTTGKDSSVGAGKVKFELDLGIYMVAETKAPSQILTKSANFIVSIPMTVKQDDGTYVWNYDVEAEPKNAPTYGGVTLIKTGRVAGNTDNGTGLSGVLFRLDIKNGEAWDAVDLSKVTIEKGKSVQTVNAAGAIDKKGQIETATDGYINITNGLAPATYRFVELEAVNGYIANVAKAYEFLLENDVATGKLVVKVDSNDVSSIEVINERPDLEKKITKRDNNTSTTHDADYGIGDKVPYTLTIKVPNTIDKLNTFKVTDTVNAEQLIYSNDFEVTVTKKGGTETPLDAKYYNKTLTNNEAVTTSNMRSVEFDFKSTAMGKTPLDAGYADAVITIKYTAKLLDGAAIGNTGNINNAKLTYSNKTNVDADNKPTTPKDNESNDAGVVYTFQTGIKKVDQNKKPLNGVKFDLYKKVDARDKETEDHKGITFNGEPKVYADPATVKALNLSSDDTEKWVKITTVVSGAEDTDPTGNPTGEAIVKGLPNGTYKFVETETLKGYNLLKDPVDATLSVNYAAKWKENSVYDADGKLVKRTYDTVNKAFDNAAMKTYTVVNRKGFNLPTTGGFGTLLFSGIGVLLVLAGVSVLFSLKKKNKRA